MNALTLFGLLLVLSGAGLMIVGAVNADRMAHARMEKVLAVAEELKTLSDRNLVTAERCISTLRQVSQ